MSGSAYLTYYQWNRDVILNRAKDYCDNDKERLREQARGRYRNLSEEEKNKKREYGKNRYRNMSEEKRQRLKEYQRNYLEAKKSQYNIINEIVFSCNFNRNCNCNFNNFTNKIVFKLWFNSTCYFLAVHY